jgi:alkylated DNA nucleotide flippase Atl1
MDDDYAELVLSVVERIPPGQVATYGDIAEIVGRGGPRQVGHVMALLGGGVPWWRVVRANGRPARNLEKPGLRLLKADKTPLKGDRVDLERARFRAGNNGN